MYHITEDSSFIVSSEITQGLIYAKEQYKFLVIKPATVELFGKFAPVNLDYTLAHHSTKGAQYFLVSTLVGEGDLVRLFSGDLPLGLSGDRDCLSLLADLICCLCISCVALGSPK